MALEPEFDPLIPPRPLAAGRTDVKSGSMEEDPQLGARQFNYLELVWKYRWWVLAATVVGLGLGHLIYLKLGPTYEATGQILVSRKITVPLKAEERSLQDWGDRSEHLALILSPLVASQAVEIGDLKSLPSFQGEDDLVEAVLDGLKVKRSAGQDRSYFNVLNLSYTSPRADDARRVVDAVIKAYARYLEQTRKENSTEVYQLTKKAHDELLATLKEKERVYQEFRKQAPLTWRAPPTGGGVGALSLGQGGLSITSNESTSTNVHQERAEAIEEQRRLNLLAQVETESKIKSLDGAMARNEPAWRIEELVRLLMGSGGQSPEEARRQQELNIFDQRLLPLILEEQKLTRRFGPDHPDVRNLRKNIATIVDYFKQQGIRLPSPVDGSDSRPELGMVRIYQDSLRQELEELKLRESELTRLYNEETARAKELAKFQVEDATLQADVNRTRALWEQMVARMSTTGIEKDNSGYTMRQIAPVKSALVFKRLMKLYGAGLGAALAVAAGLAFLREWRDTRVRQIPELRGLLGRSLLGGITEFDEDAVPESGKYPQLSESLRYLQAPHSVEAENYRTLRAALEHAAEEHDVRVLQISSPEPGDGKSTMLANLAIVAAHSGQRVLIIDADLRRPTIHQLFGLSNAVGLSDVLQGRHDQEGVLQASAVPGLHVMTAGTNPGNSAELLSRGRLKRLFAEAREHFDLVLVDGPPLLAVSDPCIISRFVDGLLLVVRMGKNNRSSLKQTRSVLETFAVPVIGIAANGVARKSADDYANYQGYYAAPTRASTLASGESEARAAQREHTPTTAV